eukprot:TRINITY_DN31650_c0_g1_i1.p2 TRINITY_DN31650_c0_g1~~TRINITY_DN31650_c0_g1_i1.p2  ORF type:complete len:138 (-),score=18.53 TRINITY_DN31650_c0_g1_i1:123-536(-)
MYVCGPIHPSSIHIQWVVAVGEGAAGSRAGAAGSQAGAAGSPEEEAAGIAGGAAGSRVVGSPAAGEGAADTAGVVGTGAAAGRGRPGDAGSAGYPSLGPGCCCCFPSGRSSREETRTDLRASYPGWSTHGSSGKSSR